MARSRQEHPTARATPHEGPAGTAGSAARTVRPGPLPNQLGQLQRSAGNRATALLVQRDPPAAAGQATKPIAEMTANEKLIEAYNRAKIAPALRQKIEGLITPEALVAALLTFAATFVVAQLTPVGWAADIAIVFTGIFVGAALYTAIKHLIGFAEARNATTPEQLDRAGQAFADAVAEIGVDALVLLLTRGMGGGRSGQPPAQSGGLVLATTSTGQLVPVAVETIPAAVAAELGLRAGAGVLVAMSSTGGPTQGQSEEQQGSDSSSDEPKPEDYEAVDTARPPAGLQVNELPPRRQRDGTIQLITELSTANGETGTVIRSYDPGSGKLIMEEAFVDRIPEQLQWVQVGSGRMRLQAYLTLRQMRRLGIGFRQLRQVKMSTIQNIRAVVEFDVKMRQTGMTPQRAVLETHSVKYAGRTLAGAGVRVVKAEVKGGKRGPIEELCAHYERSTPGLRAKNDKLLADNGLTRQSEVHWNYDIELTVEPTGGKGTPR